jgi:tetratricopeptide (TPR) repeat protein
MKLAALLAFLCVCSCACAKKDSTYFLDQAKNALVDGDAPQALVDYKKALDLLELDKSPSASIYRARALRGAADTYFLNVGDVKRAAEVYRELIAQCPEAPETLEGRVHLATILQRDFQDIPGAIAALTEALSRNPPQSAELSYRVAALYFEIRDYKQCEIEALKVTQKFETSQFADNAYFLRAQALSMMEGRVAEAEKAYRELTERFPDSELQPQAYFEMGRLKAEVGEHEKAIDFWVLALKKHPDPKLVQNAIARAKNRLRATTPDEVGNAVLAFDHSIGGARPIPKSSIEAVGGTSEEANAEAQMPAESGHAQAPPTEGATSPEGDPKPLDTGPPLPELKPE